MPVQTLDLDDIRLDGDTQGREALNEAVVAEYAEAMGRGDKFPAVQVFHDGEGYWLADGFHRYHAALKADRVQIVAFVQRGDRSDARWYAISAKANGQHGLRRTNADKARAVRMALQDRPGLSDRAIAEHVGVSHPTVTKYRSELENGGQLENFTSRTGKDGRQRPAHKADAQDGDAYDPDDIPLDDPGPADDDEPDDEADDDGEGQTLHDMAGHPIPPHLVEIFQRRDELQSLQRDLGRLKGHVRKAVEDDQDPLYARVDLAQTKADLTNATRDLKAATPHAVCPYCTGDGCKACKHLGWMGHLEYKRVPAEIISAAYPETSE